MKSSTALLASNRRRLLIGGAALVAGTVLALGSLVRLRSSGTVDPLRDSDGGPLLGSLSEKVFHPINGVPQGMIIQSVNPANPVLLFLHGGPGMPEFFLNTTHPSGLERDFTLVWWDQRGAGLSYAPDIPPQSMTLAQLIADTVAVADYLRARFGQDKIYLLGHSWGSFLGIQVAAAAPDRFHAYVGMGQVSCQLRSEVMAHREMTLQYQTRGDSAMVRRLAAAPVSMADGVSPEWMRLRDRAMHGLGAGTTRDMRSVVTGVFLPVWNCQAYTVSEKLDIWRGLSFSRRFLWEDFLVTDLAKRLLTLDLPVYVFSGRYDLTANHDLSRQYLDLINAPLKGFYTFGGSAHSPLFEEPVLAREILRLDVLQGQTQLSDASRAD